MKKILQYLRQRYFCSHDYKDVVESKWYFHYKCTKCGFERGMGAFKYKK